MSQSVPSQEFGYFYDAHYPHKVDAEAAVKVAYHTQLASSRAVKACHELLPDSQDWDCPQLDTGLST